MARREHDLFWSNPDDFEVRVTTAPRRRRVHGRRKHPEGLSHREQLLAFAVGVALLIVLALPVPMADVDSAPVELRRVAVVLPR